MADDKKSSIENQSISHDFEQQEKQNSNKSTILSFISKYNGHSTDISSHNLSDNDIKRICDAVENTVLKLQREKSFPSNQTTQSPPISDTSEEDSPKILLKRIPSNLHSIPGTTSLNYYNYDRKNDFKYFTLRLKNLNAQEIVDQEAIGKLTTSWFFNSGTFITSAPGKILICGEHSVVYGHLAIGAALDKRTYAEFHPRTDKILAFHVEIKKYKMKFEWELSGLRELAKKYHFRPSDGKVSEEFKNIIRQFIRETIHCKTMLPQQDNCLLCLLMLYLTFTSASVGLNIRVWSQLPIACGLGSSASLAACLAGGFMKIRPDLGDCDCWLSGKVEPNEFCIHSKDIINLWAFEVEMILHGTASGVDNACSVYGGAVTFQKNRDIPIQPLPSFPLLRFLVVNTQVQRTTKHLVENVRSLHDQFPLIYNNILSAINQIALEWTNTVNKWGKEMTSLDLIFQKIRPLISSNHYLLNSIGVGHPLLDRIVQICSEYNLACKLTGAGGGGCAMALIDNIEVNKLVELKNRLSNEGFKCIEVTIGYPTGLTLDYQVLDRSSKTPLYMNCMHGSSKIRKLSI